MVFYYGTPTSTQSGAYGDQSARDAQALAAIRADGSVYFKAFSMVPEAFAAAAAKEFDTMKTQSTIREGMSDYAYLQALVRQSGLSKGVGPLNQVDPKDLAAIKEHTYQVLTGKLGLIVMPRVHMLHLIQALSSQSRYLLLSS